MVSGICTLPYETAAQHKGGQTYDGNEEAGTTWVGEAPLPPVSVSLSPFGGSVRTNTVTVTATLSEVAKAGWYQIEGQDKVELTPGEAATFTIGEDMNLSLIHICFTAIWITPVVQNASGYDYHGIRSLERRKTV